MSVLAILLPPRERLTARAGGSDGAAGLRLPTEWSFVLSNDGRTVTLPGAAPLALLPRADHLVLVLAEADVSWHRVKIPKAPATRLRAALLGVMEESLLDDDEALHFALAPGAVGGEPGWVAVTHRPWLAAALAAIEAGGLSVERVVARCVPAEAPRGHFHTLGADGHAVPWLSLALADGASSVRLSGALARALQAGASAPVRWSATPAAAAEAERWLGAAVPLMTDPERALEASQGTLNLRQFDLAARHRGTRAVRELGKRFLSTEWRPVRAGLVALVAVHLLGLNAYAWQQRQAVAAKRLAMNELLKTAHPGVRAVLDAPVQMQRETERLRAAAGKPGDNDLEPLMAAAAAAWPDGTGPVQTLRFEPGRLILQAPGFGAEQVTQLRERLRAVGFAADLSEGRITVTRGAAPVAGGPAGDPAPGNAAPAPAPFVVRPAAPPVAPALAPLVAPPIGPAISAPAGAVPKAPANPLPTTTRAPGSV
jgi:general secretion pathway protein L